MNNVLYAATLALAAPMAAFAQSDISPAHKFSWQENCGWMNWRDANGALDGVRIHATFLGGWVWGENIGWISVGDGTPGNGQKYSNASGADCGVNRALDGTLYGFAWSENTGWINFGGGAKASPPNPARIIGGRFRGYAWGENIGWINLDDDEHYVGLACYADCDESGELDIDDFICFQTLFGLGDPDADCDGSGELDIDDFICFQTAFGVGCP